MLSPGTGDGIAIAVGIAVAPAGDLSVLSATTGYANSFAARSARRYIP
jgi:hypothetical protein